MAAPSLRPPNTSETSPAPVCCVSETSPAPACHVSGLYVFCAGQKRPLAVPPGVESPW